MTMSFPRFGALTLAAALAVSPVLAADKDPVVAVLNGTEIHASAVNEFRQSLPPQMAGAPFNVLVDAQINNQLVAEAARKEGIASEPDVKRALKAAEESILRKAWMSKKLRASVTDDVLQKDYQKLLANFKPEDEIKASHILVETEDKAKAVIAELRKGGDFATVAKARSKDPSAQKNGGDLGYFTKGEMVPAFADAAFAMKVGDVTQAPVKTQFGWHVIKVEDRRQTTAPTFDEAKPMIRDQIAGQMAEKIVADLRDKAKIKVFNEDGSPVSDQPAKK